MKCKWDLNWLHIHDVPPQYVAVPFWDKFLVLEKGVYKGTLYLPQTPIYPLMPYGKHKEWNISSTCNFWLLLVLLSNLLIDHGEWLRYLTQEVVVEVESSQLHHQRNLHFVFVFFPYVISLPDHNATRCCLRWAAASQDFMEIIWKNISCQFLG